MTALHNAASPAEADIERFDRVQRLVHRSQGYLFGILFATGAALYLPQISQLVGRREVMKTIHVYAGLALPLPVLIGSIGPWGAGLRADFRRLNRFSRADRKWFRNRQAGSGLRTGKFNAGQKLNAAFIGAVIPLMLATGSVMRWFGPFPLAWRTGATFVHDWIALALAVVVVGHIVYANRDQDAYVAMKRTGRIPRSWAETHAPAWLEELDRESRRAAKKPD